MSWLKNNSLKNYGNKQFTQNLPTNTTDHSACYDSFCKHWQQAHDIMKQPYLSTNESLQDSIVAFVNHIEQMMTLLLIEFRNNIALKNCQLTVQSNLLCLEYLLSENLLDVIFDWSTMTKSYNNTVRLKLIKLFELLISYNASLIVHEPILRPLLKLLETCQNNVLPVDTEKELIILLNTICDALKQNVTLIDVFFHSSEDDQKRKFLIFSLLLPFIHREGIIGQQARDAMLSCITLSQKNHDIGIYLAENSNVCPILATGISGLFSSLPRKLDVQNEDWCRLTTDNISKISSLNHLIECLEFCNKVAQISHSLVQKKLSEYLYQGFLISVLGPALLQTSLDESIAATAYLELFLRKVTNPGLLYTIIKFLLEPNYDEYRILDVLIQRIKSRSKLCIVTLALFETLVDLNSEDIMLELCFSSLIPCSHVMLSQRCKLRDFDFFGNTAKKILSLRPICCLSWSNSLENRLEHNNINSLSNENAESSLISTSMPSFYCGTRFDGSLFGNYFAYLYNARSRIIFCKLACSSWSSKYDGIDRIAGDKIINMSSSETETIKLYDTNQIDDNLSTSDIIENVKQLVDYNELPCTDENECVDSAIDVNIDDVNINNDNYSSELLNLLIGTVNIDECDKAITVASTTNNKSFKKVQSHTVLDNFSGCDTIVPNSFQLDSQFNQPKHSNNVPSDKIVDVNINDNDHNSRKINDNIEDENTNCKPSVGKFLDVILKKLEYMTSNNLYVNLRLTGLISRLAIYQQPLLQSFLLNPSLVFQPSIRSLFQILASLKHKIDQYLSKVENVEELVNQARQFLRNREYRLININKHVLSIQHLPSTKRNSYQEPFERNQTKRRSLTSQLTQMFKFGGNGIPHQPRVNSTVYMSDENNFQSNIEPMTSTITPTQHIVLCAVILDEWLKELSAITQEHCVLSFDI